MQVEVHVHAELVRLAPNNRGVLTVDVPEGAHVADLLQQLVLDTRRRVIVGLNGEAARLDQELVEELGSTFSPLWREDLGARPS
jgi:hypothetical protein